MKTLWIAILCFSPLIGDEMTWSLPEIISSLGVNASYPKIAMDGSGNVVSVWVENGFIIAKSKPIQGMWSNASILSNAGATASRLVMDVFGNATAFWLENGVVKTANKPLNGSWSTVTSLSSTGASSPQATIDGSGNIVVVWVRNGNVESSTKLFGGSWPILVDTIVSTNALSPYVAIGSNGSVVAVWCGLVNTTNSVYSARKTIQGVWSLAQAISTPSQNSGYPKIAVNSSGQAIAGWFRWDVNGFEFSNVICQAALFTNGMWTSPTDLSSPGVRIPADVQMGIGEDGSAIALWSISFDGSTYALQSSVLPANGNWMYPVDLLVNNLAPCNLSFNCILDGEYQAVFLNFDQYDLSMKIQGADIHLDGYYKNLWSPAFTLSLGGNNANPKIASVLDGNTFHSAVVWANYSGSNTVIQSVSGFGDLLAFPSNLSVTQKVIDYGVYKEYQNVFNWQGVSDATEYLVFRNGLFVTALASSFFQYTDHNQIQNQTVTYGVAAVNEAHDQTPIISIVFP